MATTRQLLLCRGREIAVELMPKMVKACYVRENVLRVEVMLDIIHKLVAEKLSAVSVVHWHN